VVRRTCDPAAPGVYGLLSALVSPRPIGWVATRSATGVDNIAPHSFYQLVSTAPPIVMISSMGEKDTVRNIRATGEFIVCGTPASRITQVNVTSVEFGPDISEFDAAGLTREQAETVSVSRVAESPYALECRCLEIHEIGNGIVVFGQVVHIAVDEAVYDGDKVSLERLNLAARLAGPEWGLLGEIVSRPRLSVDEYHEQYPDGYVD